MPELHVSAEREQRSLADRYCTDFGATVLNNAVHDAVLEDEQLGQLLDLYCRAEAANHTRKEETGADNTADTLHDVSGRTRNLATQRAREIVAETCAQVRDEAGDWADEEDHISEAEAAEARQEAREWLSYNTNPAERAGVDYGQGVSPDA